MIEECQTMQPRQRTHRSHQEFCSCGCGQLRFVLREFVSPDGLRWVVAGEQVFVPQAPVGIDLAERKKVVDMLG